MLCSCDFPLSHPPNRVSKILIFYRVATQIYIIKVFTAVNIKIVIRSKIRDDCTLAEILCFQILSIVLSKN
jgi:hypothetical protein